MQKVKIVRKHKVSDVPNTLIFSVGDDVEFAEIEKFADESMHPKWNLFSMEMTPILPALDIEQKIQDWASKAFC